MCPTSSLVSCLVYRVSSHASSRVSSCVSKSRESPKITDKSDEMMAKIGMKINAEIAQNRFQGDPRGTQNRLKIAPRSLPGTPWRPRSSQGPSGAFSTCPGIVLGSSRQRPGSARRVPKPGPGRQEERPGALRGGQNRCRGISGSKKSEFLRAPRSRTVYGAIIRRFLSIFGFFAECKNAPMYCACLSKSRFDTSRCEAQRSRDATMKNTENRPKH